MWSYTLGSQHLLRYMEDTSQGEIDILLLDGFWPQFLTIVLRHKCMCNMYFWHEFLGFDNPFLYGSPLLNFKKERNYLRSFLISTQIDAFSFFHDKTHNHQQSVSSICLYSNQMSTTGSQSKNILANFITIYWEAKEFLGSWNFAWYFIRPCM